LQLARRQNSELDQAICGTLIGLCFTISTKIYRKKGKQYEDAMAM